ncbi:hypothetical protein HNP46_005177 [Pseudomonas nitritireducens]|uniref:Uncharacterized protein n=1 Tax=Pseudomonas nitroreducens TaxID=46680 RepID=A0A7W7P4G8_PSENT|nr:hypothetical protein [Pseudomonas nitritireducens]MBB4866272.1 hypothetical protein [Pseudomonas nitritireducens]
MNGNARILSLNHLAEHKFMQIHQGENKVGDVLSLNILQGEAGERMMHLLLTQGIEIEVEAILKDSVRLIIRAPGEMLIVEEIAVK